MRTSTIRLRVLLAASLLVAATSFADTPATRTVPPATFAAARVGSYETAHDALIGSRQSLDSADDVRAVLRAAGLDVAALDADIELHSQEYAAVLARNGREAAALGLPGTPGLIVGNQLLPGALKREQLERLLAEIRRRSGSHQAIATPEIADEAMMPGA